MKKILVMEDDEILNAGLCYNIQKKEMLPISVYSIEAAKEKLKKETFDLILLDVNLPDGNGFDFAKEAMPKYNTPFIFLTAHNLEEEIIKGLQLGADDYIIKPFSIKMENYSCGNLLINMKNHIVMRRDERLSLTPTEFEILEVFVENRGQILTKDLLLEKIWDRKGNFVNEHTLSLIVSRLRNKIADEVFDYIKTIYGLGYKWSED